MKQYTAVMDTAIYTLLALVLTAVAVTQFVDARQDTATSYAQMMCDKAHGELNGQSELACGDALDAIGADYINGKVTRR